jgi:hypothetical protein
VAHAGERNDEKIQNKSRIDAVRQRSPRCPGPGGGWPRP